VGWWYPDPVALLAGYQAIGVLMNQCRPRRWTGKNAVGQATLEREAVRILEVYARGVRR
jgi:hypothetical protein